MQVPALVLVRVEPETEHPVAVPLMVENETAPLPDPPEVVSVSAVPKVPDVDDTARVACATKPTNVRVYDVDVR